MSSLLRFHFIIIQTAASNIFQQEICQMFKFFTSHLGYTHFLQLH